MKKTISLLALLISIITFAQVPQGISYQAIALNSSGNPVVSSNVGIRLSVLDNSATGTVLYTETHSKTTNAQGLFNLIIGQGTPSTGTFSTINWGTNSKFLKVEMDVAGGTNYVLVGTTQLLSVPYALAADSLVTSPGEGITLVSPNGTPYQVTVNDAGQLSLPTSGVASTVPNSLYMFGSFNSFDPTSSLLMQVVNNSSPAFYGYKYLTNGTQIKFVSSQSTSSPVYGLNASSQLANNGAAYTSNNTGFYLISLNLNYPNTGILSDYYFNIVSAIPILRRNPNTANETDINPTYNTSTNTFSFIANGVTSSSNLGFKLYFSNFNTGLGNEGFGDNLSDGSIDYNGTLISFPNTTTTPKNFRVDLVINFNGSGTYTITQIP